MAEFFTKLSPVTLKNPSCAARFLSNLIEKILLLNKRFDPILHGVFDHCILSGRRGKNAPSPLIQLLNQIHGNNIFGMRVDVYRYFSEKLGLKGTSSLARLYIIKYPTKFNRLLQKNKLPTFYSFDEILKKLREP